jgi:hypothetical protein
MMSTSTEVRMAGHAPTMRRPLIAARVGPTRPPSTPADRRLRNAKIRQLHEWLELSIERYVGLYETGSLTAGDPWVEGRSDRDILIVIDAQISGEDLDAIAAQLKLIGFNDIYLFNVVRKQDFLQTHTDYDIGMKFRGTTLFGQNLLPWKETPSLGFADQWATKGLRAIPAKLRIRALNGRCWSVEHLRDEVYFLLKQLFLCLAYRRYADTGHFPRRRRDVADAYGSAELRRLEENLGTIDQADKESLVRIAKSAIDVMQDLTR